MPPTYALLASPLLGPAIWRPVARVLTERGLDVVVPPPPNRAPRTPRDVFDHLLASLPGDRDLTLVPHSNAGAYVPLLANERVTAIVFVDAVLPPSAGQLPLAPARLLEFLRDRTEPDGLLPPWTRWWAPQDTDPLFPHPAVRDEVEAEQHRLPLSYFTQQLTVPLGWDERPCAYLAFGDTYAEECTNAAGRGWPVHTLPGRHLHMLVQPDLVAARIVAFSGTGTSTAPR